MLQKYVFQYFKSEKLYCLFCRIDTFLTATILSTILISNQYILPRFIAITTNYYSYY